jgi:dolichyl-phosphate-mannose-protein mannosyltransferase
MYVSNNALTPNPDKEPDQLTSSPREWPLATKGLRMCSWADNATKFYLVGNPFIWIGGFVSMLIMVILYGIYFILGHRGLCKWRREEYYWFSTKTKVVVVGWLLHFLPFSIMGRVTYLHHYFPCVMFVILAFGLFIDHAIVKKIRIPFIQWIICGSLALVAAGIFIYFKEVVFVSFFSLD